MRFNTTTAGITAGFVLLPKLVAVLDRLAEPQGDQQGESLEMIQATTAAMANAANIIDELRAINATNIVEHNKLVEAYKKLQTKFTKLEAKHNETKQAAVFIADCSEAYRIEAERLTKENARLLIENKEYERYSTALSDKIFDLKVELGYSEF